MDNREFLLVENNPPLKGKDIEGYDINNERYFCFRCKCSDPDCMEWRCSVSGMHLMVDIVKYRYDE